MVYALRDFGSYTVGGRLLEVTEGAPRKVQFTRSASYDYDPRGHFAVEQTYVQYFVPDRRRDAPPVVLVHGGGMHGGSTWETTPDGRPGWLHLLLDRGYEVHVVDLVERGRSGFHPGLWPGDPIVRSAEEAWTLFRIGGAEGFAERRAYPGSQFPVEAFDAFLRGFVPRWLTTGAVQTAGLIAVLERLGMASLVCHSQGGEIVFDAWRTARDRIHGILAVEPSAFPPEDLSCPLTLLAGDYLTAGAHWEARCRGWRASVAALGRTNRDAVYIDTAEAIAPGGSHFLMMDKYLAAVLEVSIASIE